MSKPFFSIFLMTRDRPQYLREHLMILRMSNFLNFEVIVSDNSEKSCEKVFAEVVGGDERFTYIRHNPQFQTGEEHCAHLPLTATCGKYVCIAIDSRIILPYAMEKVYQILSKENDPPIILFDRNNMDVSMRGGVSERLL